MRAAFSYDCTSQQVCLPAGQQSPVTPDLIPEIRTWLSMTSSCRNGTAHRSNSEYI
jgi:hypothetical protein